MALTATQVALAAEVTRESYEDVESAASSLNAAQESLLIGDLDTWALERNSADLKLKGGSDGIDLDSSRLLADIFYRVRNMLGFDSIPYELNGSMLELLELEVGQNFG